MIEPKPAVTKTALAHHGAFDYDELAQLGYSPDEVLDFSVNSNPYGPPESVREAISSVPLDRYPDRECLALRQKLAKYHNVGIENIVVGNGTAELLMLIAQAFIREDDNALLSIPSFSEYSRVINLMGATLQTHHFQLDNQTFDYKQFENLLQKTRPKVAFACHPHNPTGTMWDDIEFDELSTIHQRTLFIVDEAYINFINHDLMGIDSFLVFAQTQENILILRSLTKDYALAGLRLGYAIGHPDIIEAIRKVRPAWNVNALAQAAGIAVLDEVDWLRSTIRQLHKDKDVLVSGLEKLGLQVLPSHVHYFLVKVGNAKALRSKLLQYKIMVRDCTSFGLPEYIRIATRKPEDNAKLLEAIEQVLS